MGKREVAFHVSKKQFLLWSIVLFLLLNCAISVSAYESFTTRVQFYQGFSVTTGMTAYDPTVLPIVVGTPNEIDAVVSPDIHPLFEFPLSVSMFFGFSAVAETPLLAIPEQATAVAVLEDTAFDALESLFLPDVSFDTSEVALNHDDVLVVMIDAHTCFLLGNVIQDGTFLEFSYRQVDVHATPTPSSVPEPSPFWLFGVGIACLFGITARLRHRSRSMLLMLLLLSCLGRVASAAVVTVTIEGSGVGVVMGPALYCTQTCTETYPDKTALHLKASPDPHSTFLGWWVNGEPHEGMLVIEQDTTVTAIFESTLPPDILERRYYYYEGKTKEFVYLSLDEIDVFFDDDWWPTEDEWQDVETQMLALFHPQAKFDGTHYLTSPEPVSKDHLLHTLSALQSLPYITYAYPVFYTTPDKETGKEFGREVLTERIIVNFSEEFTDDQITEIENAYDLTRFKASPYFSHKFVYQAPSALEALEIANRLYESGKVKSATPSWMIELHLGSLPNDNLFQDHQWYLRNTGQYSGNTGEDIHLFQEDDSSVWETYHVNGEDMTIAVLDAGLETTHKDLNIASGIHYDFVEKDTNPIQDRCPCKSAEKCKNEYNIICKNGKLAILLDDPVFEIIFYLR